MRQFLLQITIGQVGRSKSKSKSSVISTFVLKAPPIHRPVEQTMFRHSISFWPQIIFLNIFVFYLFFTGSLRMLGMTFFLQIFGRESLGGTKKKKRKQVDSKVCNVLEKQIIGPFYWKCFKLELRNDFVSKKLLSINWANFHCLVIFISQKG